MTLGNVGLLANPQWSHRNIRLISSTQQAWLIRDKCDLVGRIGDMVSLLPWGGDVEIAGTAGLKWTITHDTLRIGTTLGISNELVCEHAKIKVKSGQLLCVHTTQ
jgi:thiamine pyrophosphokinase